jgi:hypothetical protein
MIQQDNTLDLSTDKQDIDLFAEELPEQIQLLSDCLSTASSGVCGLSTVGSVISTGSSKSTN